MDDLDQQNERRVQAITDMRNLIDYLAARPDVPLRGHNILSHTIGSYLDDDEAGLAELDRIAEALEVPVTKSGDAHFYATKRFGVAAYEASYVLRERMEEHYQEQAHLAERRKAVES